ncbi:hypothetical protein [Alienimonas californiensis]|uniref:Uncharacterized protein n=1 Tax=Alienimonas californiensis TaxID=2527989 RepID=A0A517PCH8_9PLAN|nr:hypothetical protein [Alienimonas californiensis]QDT17075.1 hypothetical protein CA12_31870 [Alienimonas californiensis]
MPLSPPPAAPDSPRRPVPLALWLIPAAVVATLVGCAGGVQEGVRETTVHLRAIYAAEKAFLHRGDLFHNCCSSPLDFKHGFKDGYVEVALNGDDVCASPTPPSCYWGCGTGDACSRTELLNCYYDGWAHGAIAAAQDGVVGMNTVPVRNICGDLGHMPPGFDHAPGRPTFGGPPPYAPPGLEGSQRSVPAAPAAPLRAPVWDEPLDGGPTPAPIPLLPPADGEESVGGATGDDALQRLLDADGYRPLPAPEPLPEFPADPAPVEPPAGDAEPDFPPLDDPFREAEGPVTRFTPAGAIPTLHADPVSGPGADGPRVTALWGASE